MFDKILILKQKGYYPDTILDIGAHIFQYIYQYYLLYYKFIYTLTFTNNNKCQFEITY
jgi:hypothetical protein